MRIEIDHHGNRERGACSGDERPDEGNRCFDRAYVQISCEPADLRLCVPHQGNCDRDDARQNSLFLWHAEEINAEYKDEREGCCNIALAKKRRPKRISGDPHFLPSKERDRHREGINTEDHASRDQKVGTRPELLGSLAGIKD